MRNNCENFDGVIEYEATLGLDNVRNNPFDEDNFYPMDGSSCVCGCCPKCERKSNALGGLIPSSAEMKKNRARRQTRKDSRQARKDARVGVKMTQAEASKIASQSLGKESASDVALAQALASQTPVAKSGMSKNAKIGIIVGSVILVGVLGYFAYKKFSKKGKN
jgi:cobalamin biosynthesis Mg chelatase CobN